MQRRTSPLRRSDSILLYGFGLALALSLLFNGFLLYEQSHRRSIYDDESGSSGHLVDNRLWQQQLSDGQLANQQKNSRIGGPTNSPVRASNVPPGKVVAIQRNRSK